MKSMTGYGTASYASSKLEIDINIRAVNGRYFDVRMHIPREYLSLESEIKKRINTVVKRGTLDLYINRRSLQSNSQNISINTPLAKKWLASYKGLGKTLKLTSDINLRDIANQPGVFQSYEHSHVTAEEKKQLLLYVEKAAKLCNRERSREGKALQKHLLQDLTELQKLSQKMQKYRSKANSELKKRYEARLEKLGMKSELDSQRMAQEVSILIDKADVSEEMTRLKEHIRACQSLVRAGQVSGKKLDFYCQELLREVNTVGSKSQLSQLTGLVVNAKSVIEKFREQVQNVE